VVTTVSGAKRLGSGARGLSPWDSIRLEAPGRTPIEITATPCRHGPPAVASLIDCVRMLETSKRLVRLRRMMDLERQRLPQPLCRVPPP
jgi:hypothetical protein